MSAYIVDNDTMCRVLQALAVLGDKFNGKDLLSPKERLELGNELFRLNNMAVNARYKTRRRAPKYQDEPVTPRPPTIQLYKALACFIYQCSEDKADTTRLFRKLQEAKAKLAEHIVNNSVEYKACTWG